MALFTKKDPCAICGGKVKGLFPWSIDGQLICSECHGSVDLPAGVENSMSMDDFRAYMIFREENNRMKEKFQVTQQVDFGFFDTKFVFDMTNRLLCFSKNLGTTVFEGVHIKSFTIREDATPLFEGSAAGLRRYVSTVPERAIALAPQIDMYRMRIQMQRERQGDNNNSSAPRMDIPEPFKTFNVEIKLEHPYWQVFRADMEGPVFDNNDPDVNNYLNTYTTRAATMEQLAQALMQVAFPGTPEQTISAGTATVANMGTAVYTAPTATVDAVGEIQRYKALMDQGLLTEEEFAAKKRQLLGI